MTSDRIPNLSTLAIHADDSDRPDVAAPLHVSTTFRYDAGWNDRAAVAKGMLPPSEDNSGKTANVYARDSTEVRTRLETVLGQLENSHAVTYSTGLASIFAALHVFQPKHILTNRLGYHGKHQTFHMYTRGRSDIKISYLEDDVDGKILRSLEPGDMVWFESPQNPCGEVEDFEYYNLNRKKGVILAVDATMAPAPLQFTLDHGKLLGCCTLKTHTDYAALGVLKLTLAIVSTR
eukprot:jgi/Hompol1/2444/HPOL_002917-RA